MQAGAITGYVDVAQVTLYVFWAFFAGLVYYLHRENKREGYPLVSDRTARTSRVSVRGFPDIPPPKMFHDIHDAISYAPQTVPPDGPIDAAQVLPFPGAPLEPTGDPMTDGIGPASWVMRRDEPDRTIDGKNKIVPLRITVEYGIDGRSFDPRGWNVVGLDGVVAGRVVDLWIDEVEHKLRYLEVEVNVATVPRRAILPDTFVRYDRRRRQVLVRAILAAQFANVPHLANPDQITFREEDRITAYFGGGLLYAIPSRLEPYL